MISLPIGMSILALVIVFASHGNDLSLFLNFHAFLVVVLGTTGVFAYATPTANIRGLLSSIARLWKRSAPLEEINAVLLQLTKNKGTPSNFSHPLLSYAHEVWQEGLDKETFTALLAQRVSQLNQISLQAVATTRNLAKYPPALGMMGTVMGLVLLFAHLTPGARESLGPNLALAMTATLYGLVLANAVLLPLSDRLHVEHLRSSAVNEYLFHVLVLIEQGEPEVVIRGELREQAA